MIGDFVIIFLGIASLWSAYKLFTMETKYTAFTFSLGLFLVSFVIGGIIAPNSNLLNEFMTPEINGVLIDAESNKPLPNVDVVVGWESDFYILMSTVHSRLKSIHIKTDSNGKFHAPKHYKSLALNVPFGYRENSKSHISIFSLDYLRVNSNNIDNQHILYLKKINNHGMLKDNYNILLTLKDIGNKNEKALAITYLDIFKKHRLEYIKKYKIPIDSQYWLGGM